MNLFVLGVKFKSPEGEDFGAAFEFPISLDDIREAITGKGSDSANRGHSTWTPVPMRKLEPISEGAKNFFTIPHGVLPSHATDILVFVIIEVDPVGDGKEEELLFVVSTREGKQKSEDKTVLPYAMYVHMWSHKTMRSSSSHNLWLPLTTERYVTVETLHGGQLKLTCTLYLTGYR